MLITCPSCQAEYDVPGAITPGRMVKCVRCQTKWTPVAAPPADVAPAPEPIAPPPPEPTGPLAPRPKQRPARPAGLTLAWLASILLLLAIIAAAVNWREPVMRGWPPSQRLYGWLGLRSGPSQNP